MTRPSNHDRSGGEVGAHLTDEEAFDAIEGALSETGTAHLAGCHECQATVDDLRATIALVQEVDVPEPSPAFWDAFSTRITMAVACPAAEPLSQRVAELRQAWKEYFAWRTLRFAVPCAVAVAGLVLAVAAARPALRSGQSRSVVASAAKGTSESSTAAPPAGLGEIAAGDGSDSWDILASMWTDDELDASEAVASDAFTVGDAVEFALADLSEDERQELMVELRAALGGRGA